VYWSKTGLVLIFSSLINIASVPVFFVNEAYLVIHESQNYSSCRKYKGIFG
jgi:hypothetical protein